MTEPTGARPGDFPLVSAIICTRNRPADIPRAVRSILSSDYPNFEALIVDQSDNDATADALAPLLVTTSRLRLLRLAAGGKAAALNHARRHAHGQYLALTDDDCEMAANCLSTLVTAFTADSGLGGIFGDVAAADSNRAREYIPQFRMHLAKTISRPGEFLRIPPRRRAWWQNFGMGANMAVDAAALQEIGGFDECIGPGEKFASGDDHDLAFRLLHAGYRVHFCPNARVVHYRARQVLGIQQDHWRVGQGFGACFAKYFRCGILYRGSIRALGFHFLRFGFQRLSLRASESGFFMRGWLSGFFGGLRHPMNKKTLRFERDVGTKSSVPYRRSQSAV
jgi:O-antigen biosynthesis protein